MFANMKRHRIINMPPLEKQHFLVKPKSVEDAKVLRVLQKMSVKASSQRNRLTLNELERERLRSQNDFYLSDPEYKKLDKKYWELDYSNPEKQKTREKMDEIKERMEKNYNDNWKKKKSMNKEDGVLRRFSWKNQFAVERAIEAKDYWDLPDEVTRNALIKKIKSDPEYTPKRRENLFWAIYRIEKDKVDPLRKEWQDAWDESHKMWDKIYGKDSYLSEKSKTELKQQHQELKVKEEALRKRMEESEGMVQRLKESTGIDFDKKHDYG